MLSPEEFQSINDEAISKHKQEIKQCREEFEVKVRSHVKNLEEDVIKYINEKLEWIAKVPKKLEAFSIKLVLHYHLGKIEGIRDSSAFAGAIFANEIKKWFEPWNCQVDYEIYVYGNKFNTKGLKEFNMGERNPVYSSSASLLFTIRLYTIAALANPETPDQSLDDVD